MYQLAYNRLVILLSKNVDFSMIANTKHYSREKSSNTTKQLNKHCTLYNFQSSCTAERQIAKIFRHWKIWLN